MKTYIIGRQEDCDIVIIDPTQMVSRHHAVLTVSGRKMTITDQSSNGTYINGIKIAAGAPVPVTRKDVVSFAQAAELNWARIPDPSRKMYTWIAIAAIVLLGVGFGGKIGYDKIQEGKMQVVLDQKGDSLKLAAINDAVVALSKDYTAIVSTADSLKTVYKSVEASVEKKVPGKALNKVLKEIAQIETSLQSVKPTELNEAIVALKATLEYQKNPAELEKKVKPLQEQVDLYKQTLKQCGNRLAKVEEDLKNISNKQGGSGHHTPPDGTNEKPSQEIYSNDEGLIF